MYRSTTHVCLRLIGEDYSERFEELSSGMDLHYYDKSAIPGLQDPDIGKIYAAQVSSDWHRVKVSFRARQSCGSEIVFFLGSEFGSDFSGNFGSDLIYRYEGGKTKILN